MGVSTLKAKILLFLVLLSVSLNLVVGQADEYYEAEIEEQEPSSSTTIASRSRSRTRPPVTAAAPAAVMQKARPTYSYCIKHPPNFLEVDLPCGGYDKPSCDKVCKQLGRSKSYCSKQVFCLCHSGDLYSC